MALFRTRFLLGILGTLIISNVVYAQSKLKAIRAGKLIDVVNGTVLTNQVILIDSNKIADIGPALSIPANAEIIDLGNATVLPGLIDCHTHLTNQPSGDYYGDIFRKSPIDVAVTAHICKANIRSRFYKLQ
jgi:imidazolonepropionase-like amidohydrolase